MKQLTLSCALALATMASANAAPVHIALRAHSAAQANADGFLSLASVADLSGGEDAARKRLGAISVGRAPLPGESRRMTQGDIALKLRQNGFHPGQEAVVEGAPVAEITISEAEAVVPAPGIASASPGASAPPAAVPKPVLVHRNDPVTIVIQDAVLTISARGVARENGALGETIHVHRDGVMSDLSVTVVDAQTVRLEVGP